MLRRYSLLLVLMACLLPQSAFSLSAPRVTVLPFDILSRSQHGYLKTEIPKVIAGKLREEGADIITIKKDADTWSGKDAGTEAVRKIGIKTGADYVIWGSLTWIGNTFSLDARMLESFSKNRPQFFFRQGSGIENLLGAVGELSKDIGLKIFKREKVADIVIEGNDRIEADAIRRIIKTQTGDVYLAKSLSRDLKAVYAMGYFDDIRIESEDGPSGKTIIFKVTEKPTIRVIRVNGNRVYEDDKVLEALNIRTGSILNVFQVQNNVERIKSSTRIKTTTTFRSIIKYKKPGITRRIWNLSFRKAAS